jgi:hypothetical protein
VAAAASTVGAWRLQQERLERMNKLLIGVVIIGMIFGCVIVGFGGVFAIFQQEVAATREVFGEDILKICDPIRGGTASEGNLPGDHSYPLQVVVIQEGMPYVGSLHDNLNLEWQAANREEIDIVICVRYTSQIVESCAYGDADDEEEDMAFIEREQQLQEIFLFDPATRAKIAEITLEGALPEACPDQVRARDGSTRTQTGPEIEFSMFEDAIRPYITGNS